MLSPTLAKWLNRDPLEEEGGINLYAFCLNNPVSTFDPLGKMGEEIPVFGAVATVAVGGSILSKVKDAVRTYENVMALGGLAEGGLDNEDDKADAFIDTLIAGREQFSVNLARTVTTVIGHLKEGDIQAAGELFPGANIFKGWKKGATEQENWQRNLKWLAGAIQRGEDIYIASNPVRENSYTMKEIKVLQSRGYEWETHPSGQGRGNWLKKVR